MLGGIGGGFFGAVGGILDSSLDSIFGNIGMKNQYAYNAKSQKKQFLYNRELQREQMMFDAYEAEKSRQFASAQAAQNYNRMLYLSNTAHQREVKDLRAAGLNPILSATGGSGASTFNVATPTANQAHGSSASVSAMGVSAPMIKSHMAESAASFINALANVQRVNFENKLADAQVANVNSATRLTNIKAAREDFSSLYDEAFKKFQLERELIGIKEARSNLQKSIFTLNKMAVDDSIENTSFGRAMKIYDRLSGFSGNTFGVGALTHLSDYIGRRLTGSFNSFDRDKLFDHSNSLRGVPSGRSWQRRYHDNGLYKRSVIVYPYK